MESVAELKKEKKPTDIIHLISKEGDGFDIERQVIELSILVKGMLDDAPNPEEPI